MHGEALADAMNNKKHRKYKDKHIVTQVCFNLNSFNFNLKSSYFNLKSFYFNLMSPYFNLISRYFNLKSFCFNLNSFYFNLRVKRCSRRFRSLAFETV